MIASPGGAARLAARIADGSSIALPRDASGGAMAVIRELVRREARGLRLVGVPQLGLAADLLIGAGCVAAIETAAISLGEQGAAPCFQRAFRTRSLRILDSTCPAIHAGLTAAERGVPFLPLPGVIGTDLVAARPDWRVIDDPFAPERRILLVPAIRPDVALFHAVIGDADGHVWIGVQRELMTMAHAARATLVTVEERRAGSLLDDPALAAGTVPSLYVDAVELVPGGGAPLGCGDRYPRDEAFIGRYAAAAATAAGFAAFLDGWLGDG